LTQLFAAGFNIFPPCLGLATADLETLRDNNLGRSCVVMLMATDGIPRDFGPERSNQRFGVSGAALEVQPLFDPQSGGRCEALRHVD